MSVITEELLTDAQVERRHVLLAGVLRVQQIESNPLTPDEVAMFEMFDREAWSEERCIEHIRQSLSRRSILPA